MDVRQQLEQMISVVADALGPELLQQMAFVGGCTTCLLVSDISSLQQLRHTDDVDLIVGVMGWGEWARLQELLREKGFRERMGEPVICRMYLGDLMVDFMPDNEAILKFTNYWYKDALQTAWDHTLTTGHTIRLLKSEYFLATKLEAFKGRGNDDLLASKDIEDLFSLIAGRTELLGELRVANDDVKNYLSENLINLTEHDEYQYAVQTAAGGDSEREEYLYLRVDEIIALAKG